MSQIVTRKNAVTDEKDKRTDSPVKDMKKKVAANAEKEKQAEKPAEKQAEKVEKPKQTEKPAEKPKQTEKPADKKQTEKPAEKNEKAKQPEKAPENKADKSGEKTDKKVEKNGVENKKTEKNGQEKKDDKAEKNGKSDAKRNGSTSKQNGSKQNGDANGVDDSDDDVLEIPDDDEFPELAYDDSDNEAPSPDGLRSATRRSQGEALKSPESLQPAAEKSQENQKLQENLEVKATRTPETPQPATEKTQENASTADEPKDKVLKLSEAPPTDRKLRSDDPKEKEKEKKEEPKKKENGEKEKDEDVIEIEDDEPRKTDTNYSKSRVKVSPYRRSTRIHDQTTSSVMANYTGPSAVNGHRDPPPTTNGAPQPRDPEPTSFGATSSIESGLKSAQVVLTPIALVPPYNTKNNVLSWLEDSVANYSGNNTTMEMDITAETSSFAEDESMNDSSYLHGLRAIKGRRSYKPLKELAIKHNRSVRSNVNISLSDSSRPTGTVVGRKRKPEDINDSVELATDAGSELSTAVHTKRMRLLDRIAQPFRRTLASTPLPNRRNPEIVGINTDLPLTAPVSTPETFDPETLKPAPAISVTPPTPTGEEMDKKRCVIM